MSTRRTWRIPGLVIHVHASGEGGIFANAYLVESPLDGRNRYAILFRIQTAKKAETRAKRIREFITMLERGETLYP